MKCKEEKDGMVFGVVILRAKGSKEKSQQGWVPTSHLERYILGTDVSFYKNRWNCKFAYTFTKCCLFNYCYFLMLLLFAN